MNNKEIRKKRTLIFFIEATQEIIAEEGIDNVTIRKVAAKAGYNSATLYNYFDNLDQLKMYASLKHVNLYNKDFAEMATSTMSERDKFRLMWHLFIKHTIKHPQAFSSIFRTPKPNDSLSSIFSQYNELFPEEMILPFGTVYTFDQYVSLYERNLTVIKKIYQEEEKDTNNIELINGLMIYTYNGILDEILSAKTEKEKALLEKKMISYIDYLLDIV